MLVARLVDIIGIVRMIMIMIMLKIRLIVTVLTVVRIDAIAIANVIVRIAKLFAKLAVKLVAIVVRIVPKLVAELVTGLVAIIVWGTWSPQMDTQGWMVMSYTLNMLCQDQGNPFQLLLLFLYLSLYMNVIRSCLKKNLLTIKVPLYKSVRRNGLNRVLNPSMKIRETKI